MHTIDYRVPAGKEIIACSVDYADVERIPSVICLHDGGQAAGALAELKRAAQVFGL